MTGFYQENFIDEATVAASVAATRCIKVSGGAGHIYAACIAGKGGFSIASGKKVTLTASESDTDTGTFAANGIVSARTFAADTVFAEGETICEIAFPSYAKNYGKVAFTTDDTTATGKIKVIPAAVG